MTAMVPRAGVPVNKKRGPRPNAGAPVETSRRRSGAYAVNELPQPQPPVAFGFLNVNPEPIIVVT